VSSVIGVEIELVSGFVTAAGASRSQLPDALHCSHHMQRASCAAASLSAISS
jgi:hypothetical protein